MPRGSVVVGLLATVLAGCLTPPAAACGPVTIPSGHTGLEATYAAHGTAAFPITGVGGFVDWGRIESVESEEVVDPELPDGSSVRIAVRETPLPILNYSGGWEDAYQATYWLDFANRSAPFPFGSEWIDTEDGAAIADTSRAATRFPDLEEQAHGQGRLGWNRSPLLMAPMFWDESLGAGDRGTLPIPGRLDSEANASMQWEVASVESTGGSCAATVVVEQDLSGWEHVTIELRLETGTPLPVGYRLQDSGGHASFTMRLSDLSDGAGSSIPALDPHGPGPSVLRQAPPRDGFLPERGGVFPTDYDEAVEAAEDDEETRVWLQAHPDARPARVTHRMGHTNSSIVDQWSIVWLGPEDDRHGVVVRNKSATPLRVQDSKRTGSLTYTGDLAYPDTSRGWVPMAALADLARRMYGEDPEILVCTTGRGRCLVGTHAAMGLSRPCDRYCVTDGGGGGVFWGGLVVNVTTGRVVNEQSQAHEILHPPAGG